MAAEKKKDSELVRMFKDLVAGTVGGVALCLVGHPLDTLKVRLQTQPSPPLYSGLVDCFVKTVKWEGYSGLYKGVASPLIGQMAFNAVQFVAYGQAKELVKTEKQRVSGEDLTVSQYFTAGLLTGFAVSFVEGPIDLVKSQMQVQIFNEKATAHSAPAGEQIRFTSVFDCAKQLYVRRGVVGLYQGLGSTILRDVPAVGCYFGFYELTKRYLVDMKQAQINHKKERGEEVSEPVAKADTSILLAAGGMAGIGYWTLIYPLDVIKSSMQGDSIIKDKRKYKNIVDCAAKLFQQGGVSMFFRGFTPAILRAVPANAACFLAYEKTLQMIG